MVNSGVKPTAEFGQRRAFAAQQAYLQKGVKGRDRGSPGLLAKKATNARTRSRISHPRQLCW